MKWIPIGAGAVAGFALCWLIHLVILAGVEKSHTAALAKQKTDLEAMCTADQAITKGKNDALQTDLDIVRRKLADAKRVQPATCVVPLAGKTNVGEIHGGYAGQNGISSDWLRDYGAECESIRRTLNSCTGFVDDVWTARGQ